MDKMKRTAIFTIFATILGLTACSNGTPLDPADASGGAPAPAQRVLGDLDAPLLPDSLIVVDSVVSVLEVEERFYLGAEGLVSLGSTILTSGVLGGDGLLASASLGAPRFFLASSNDTETTRGTDERVNPCTGETFTFTFTTRVQSKDKRFKDGSRRIETDINTNGRGVTPTGVKYTGHERSESRTFTSPQKVVEFQFERVRYIRQGESVENDDFYFSFKQEVTFYTDGRPMQIRTKGGPPECD